MKQIFAIGGGGFSSPRTDLKLEKHLLTLSEASKPKVCFLPQASNEAQNYVVKFYEVFCKLGADPSWLSLFGNVEDGWKEKLLSQDIIYVGGGNTRSMMALWKEWGVDLILRKAYEKGVIMAGVSAGAICWFEQGITDSVWPLGIVEALGFLTGSCCPHFDTEKERQEVYRQNIAKNRIKPGIALEDWTAAHYIDGELYQTVMVKDQKNAILIKKETEEVLHPLPI